MSPNVIKESKNIIKNIWSIYWTLLKIMVPVLLLVKLLTIIGFTEWMTLLIEPFLSMVGLPTDVGVVIAVTALTNMYGGVIIFADVVSHLEMTLEQITVLCGIMLFAHGLPLEGAIAKKAGMPWYLTLTLRLVGGFAFGVLLHFFYQRMGYLQQPYEMVAVIEQSSPTLLAWGLTQIKSFIIIFFIIAILILLLKCLKWLRIEALFHYFLRPILRLLGISKDAINFTVIGMLLGLSFGGGLLIHESNTGKLQKKDVFLAMCFLSICHSLIEDTLLVLFLGAHVSGVLWGRLLFSAILVSSLSVFINSRVGQRVLKLTTHNQ